MLISTVISSCQISPLQSSIVFAHQPPLDQPNHLGQPSIYSISTSQLGFACMLRTWLSSRAFPKIHDVLPMPGSPIPLLKLSLLCFSARTARAVSAPARECTDTRPDRSMPFQRRYFSGTAPPGKFHVRQAVKSDGP